MKKFAVVLCGCGALDGSEVHEATFTLLALSQLGFGYHCFAPNLPQVRVLNFLSREPHPEIRNQRIEAGRIARGIISDLQDLKADDFDGLVIPGGTGVAYNLCNYAEAGLKASVNSELSRCILAFNDSKKPIGAICIAPILLALVFGHTKHPLLTAGDDAHPVAADMQALGCQTKPCAPEDCLVDLSNKIITTPAYMNAQSISEVYQGIFSLATSLQEMLKNG